MKGIQATAIILWVVIFVIAAFVLGQFLVSKNIFDITSFITLNDKKEEDSDNEENIQDEIQNDVVINKVGQETVRIGQNVAKDYFSNYYREYINYVMQDSTIYKLGEKIAITNDIASDYVFYAFSKGLDTDKYISNINNNKLVITEANANSFIDKIFEQEISKTYKENSSNGYNKESKTYSIQIDNSKQDYVQELISMENITSNQMILKYDCKKVVEKNKNTEIQDQKEIDITIVYRGGRYIITEVQKLNKD